MNVASAQSSKSCAYYKYSKAALEIGKDPYSLLYIFSHTESREALKHRKQL